MGFVTEKRDVQGSTFWRVVSASNVGDCIATVPASNFSGDAERARRYAESIARDPFSPRRFRKARDVRRLVGFSI